MVLHEYFFDFGTLTTNNELARCRIGNANTLKIVIFDRSVFIAYFDASDSRRAAGHDYIAVCCAMNFANVPITIILSKRSKCRIDRHCYNLGLIIIGAYVLTFLACGDCSHGIVNSKTTCHIHTNKILNRRQAIFFVGETGRLSWYNHTIWI